MAPCLFPMSRALGGHSSGDAKFVDYAQLDAFTGEAFKGNPAFVCILPTSRTTEWMQSVAGEFNAPMSAFLIHRPNPQNASTSANTQSDQQAHTISPGESVSEYDVRFFTPTSEFALCGHATLASASLLFTSNVARGSEIIFHAGSPTLKARKVMDYNSSKEWKGQVEIEFPIPATSPASNNPEDLNLPRTLQGLKVLSSFTTEDRLLVELPSARDVETLKPHFDEISAGPGALVVTGKGTEGSGFDFVTRFFAPKYGVREDPVCGTAHCALAPMWAAKLGMEKMLAFQASQRGGVLDVSVHHDSQSVSLRGSAVMVASGVLLC